MRAETGQFVLDEQSLQVRRIELQRRGVLAEPITETEIDAMTRPFTVTVSFDWDKRYEQRWIVVATHCLGETAARTEKGDDDEKG